MTLYKKARKKVKKILKNIDNNNKVVYNVADMRKEHIN